jgi:hypothetical protein|tara:strand:- start:1131 stop:2054 length:924 start_codon:yes stop_codon:yes gene_type:complete
MATYNLKYNSDDSVIRHMIIGLLADLNNKVYFKRQTSATTRVMVDVPFYYSITGDDEFLRDHFLFDLPSGPACDPVPGRADGNYDSVPRGVANLSNLSIDSGRLVNKGIRGEYTKMDAAGVLQNYTAEFEMIPITMSFDIEILVSSMLDALKITEAIAKTLYKTNYYNVEVGHLEEGIFRLPAQYALPDDFEIARPIDFTFDDKEQYKANFSIEVSSHIPSFEQLTEMHAGKRMYNNNTQTSVLGNIGSAPPVAGATGSSLLEEPIVAATGGTTPNNTANESSTLLGGGHQHGLIVKDTGTIKSDGI